MKQRILPFLFLCSGTVLLHAQDGKKIPAFAITSTQKGGSAWTEVRLVDAATGEELKSIYKSGGNVEVFNARTGKLIPRKAVTEERAASSGVRTENVSAVRASKPVVRIDNIDAPAPNPTVIRELSNANLNLSPNALVTVEGNRTTVRDGNRTIVMVRSERQPVDEMQPFATNSAALAYDAKHERLYYTPMGIAQLRYIDLKSGKIHFFEGEAFGPLKSRHEVEKQITRMAIASDGNGYALTNDGNHLIRFSLEKKPGKTEITDLGALTDDAVNGSYSVHNRGGFGGDMVADANKNLYLITANRNVYRIRLENRVATFLGTIKGLPRGFTTNGAVVEEGGKVIVSSSGSTMGYFRFDLNSLEAEKLSNGTVFNASDLANGSFAFAKKKNKEQPRPQAATNELADTRSKFSLTAIAEQGTAALQVYPNPVTAGLVKLNFTNQPRGQYNVQLLDLSGKLITERRVTLGGKSQVEELRIPGTLTTGTYLVRVAAVQGKTSFSTKIIVE